MLIVATVLVFYTVLMLAVHLSSWKLMESWHSAGKTWAKRWFPSHRAVRFEAAYWLIALIGWPLWGPFAAIVVAVFGAIHIGLWIGLEVKRMRSSLSMADNFSNRTVMFAVATFDFVECFALAVAGYSAALYLFHR